MKKIIYALLSFAPVMAFAQVNQPTVQPISNLVSQIGGLLQKVIPIIFALAIIYFFWGLIGFLRANGDPKALTAARDQMIWSVIIIAVMVSIYGLVGWLQGAFGLTNITQINLPTVPTN